MNTKKIDCVTNLSYDLSETDWIILIELGLFRYIMIPCKIDSFDFGWTILSSPKCCNNTSPINIANHVLSKEKISVLYLERIVIYFFFKYE